MTHTPRPPHPRQQDGWKTDVLLSANCPFTVTLQQRCHSTSTHLPGARPDHPCPVPACSSQPLTGKRRFSSPLLNRICSLDSELKHMKKPAAKSCARRPVPVLVEASRWRAPTELPSASPAKLIRHTHKNPQSSCHRACTAAASGPRTSQASSCSAQGTMSSTVSVQPRTQCGHTSSSAAYTPPRWDQCMFDPTLPQHRVRPLGRPVGSVYVRAYTASAQGPPTPPAAYRRT